MIKTLTLHQLNMRFPSDESCLEEIKRLRFPKGVLCPICKKITKYYLLSDRKAYSCEYCRTQMYPLKGTIFEKTTTPLRTWFYALFLMVHTRGKMPIVTLQKELGVTYKTAWRMYQDIKTLMLQNNGDLLAESEEVVTWTLFNTFEFKVVQKKGTHST